MALQTREFKSSDAIVGQLAGYEYPLVFADKPWNEWVKCKNESTLTKEVFWGLSSGLMPRKPCPSCGEPLSKYYEYDATYAKIMAELQKPGTIAVLGLIRGGVAGFAWSYRTDIMRLAELKWPESRDMQDNVITTLANYVNPQTEIRYLSEVGVMPNARRQGVATRLSKLATRDNLPIVVRSDQKSPMVKICKDFGLIQVVGPKLEMRDTIRPNRVLYVSPRN